jgi:hypothetical protein
MSDIPQEGQPATHAGDGRPVLPMGFYPFLTYYRLDDGTDVCSSTTDPNEMRRLINQLAKWWEGAASERDKLRIEMAGITPDLKRRLTDLTRLLGPDEPSTWLLDYGRMMGRNQQYVRELARKDGEIKTLQLRLMRRTLFRDVALGAVALYGLGSLAFLLWLYASGQLAVVAAEYTATLFDLFKLRP